MFSLPVSLLFYTAEQTGCFNQLSGDVTRGDLQRRFLTQHSVAMLEQCCINSKQRRNNVATLSECCAKNRRCESSRATSLLAN